MKKISVIIPVYNTHSYLEECIRSVMNQTLKEIEIICVDDKSTDSSLALLRKLEKEDERIQVISLEENGGQSIARNIGVEKAGGEFIQFVDSDDWIAEETLETLYNEMKRKELEILYFDANTVFESSELRRQQVAFANNYIRDCDYSIVTSGKRLFVEFMKNHHFRVSPCMQMLRLSFLKKHNITFYPGIVHEDELFTFATILLAEKAAHISKRFYQRRVREGSTMTEKKEFESSYGYFVSLREGLSSKGVAELTENDEKDAVKKWALSLQWGAVRQIEKMQTSEIDDHISTLPYKEQIEYSLLVKNIKYGLPSFSQRVHRKVFKELRKIKRRFCVIKGI